MHIWNVLLPMWDKFPPFSKNLSWLNKEPRRWETLPLLSPEPSLVTVSPPRHWRNPRSSNQAERLKGWKSATAAPACAWSLITRPCNFALRKSMTMSVQWTHAPSCCRHHHLCEGRPSHPRPHLHHCQIWRTRDSGRPMRLIHPSKFEYWVSDKRRPNITKPVDKPLEGPWFWDKVLVNDVEFEDEEAAKNHSIIECGMLCDKDLFCKWRICLSRSSWQRFGHIIE